MAGVLGPLTRGRSPGYDRPVGIGRPRSADARPFARNC